MTRPMVLMLCAVLLFAGTGFAFASELAPELSFFEPLLGTRWVGRFEDEEESDLVHVAEWGVALDGHAVRYRKNVSAAQFSTESIYYWDSLSASVEFVSVTNRGQVSTGTASATEQGIELLGEQRALTDSRRFRYTLRLSEDGRLEDRFFNAGPEGWSQGHLVVYEADAGEPEGEGVGVGEAEAGGARTDAAPPEDGDPEPTGRAEAGDVSAQFALGMKYVRGHGVQQDYAAGFRWLRMAAEAGHSEAQNNLALMYWNGHGVQRNDAEAVRWYMTAAENGHAGAQCTVGVMYAGGHGVEKDQTIAVEWFLLAADQGHPGAQVNLGTAYSNGYGVEEDAEEAARWYELAAEQGLDMAQHKLGVAYAEGEGVEQDHGLAMKWFRLAAEQGNAESQYELGVMHAFGVGTPVDLEKARFWLSSSAEQGHEMAKSTLMGLN